MGDITTQERSCRANTPDGPETGAALESGESNLPGSFSPVSYHFTPAPKSMQLTCNCY